MADSIKIGQLVQYTDGTDWFIGNITKINDDSYNIQSIGTKDQDENIPEAQDLVESFFGKDGKEELKKQRLRRQTLSSTPRNFNLSSTFSSTLLSTLSSTIPLRTTGTLTDASPYSNLCCLYYILKYLIYIVDDDGKLLGQIKDDWQNFEFIKEFVTNNIRKIKEKRLIDGSLFTINDNTNNFVIQRFKIDKMVVYNNETYVVRKYENKIYTIQNNNEIYTIDEKQEYDIIDLEFVEVDEDVYRLFALFNNILNKTYNIDKELYKVSVDQQKKDAVFVYQRRMNIESSDSDYSLAIASMDIDSSGNIILSQNPQVQRVNKNLYNIKGIQQTLRSDKGNLLRCVLNQ